VDAIWNLEKVGAVSKLMALMRADVKKGSAHARAKIKAKPKNKKRH
jgi:hypothetical protein